jgi:hypothetical protein
MPKINQELYHESEVTKFYAQIPLLMDPNSVVAESPQAWAYAYLQMLNGAMLYSKLHKFRYDEPVGMDFYIGTVMEDILVALKELLNGELGNLDAGPLNKLIRKFAEENALELPQ